jgi:crotonobetainyl-CoA:carnitine CoA-transferase CaiB-like acyl-CoA transferase
VPRNTYQTSDGKWVAVSSSAESVAQRVLQLIGLDGDTELAGFDGRVAHRGRIDSHMAEWMLQRTQAQALAEFEQVDAAAAPVYDMADIFADPQYQARNAIITVDGVPMPQLIAQLSATPGAVRWAGRAQNQDAAQIRAEAGEGQSDSL